MEDREMLEMAAKAAGLVGSYYKDETGEGVYCNDENDCGYAWNPAADDGDCARMEAMLGIDVDWAEDGVIARNRDKRAGVLFEDHNNNRNAARRMASLRVAAEIGRAMPSDKR